MLKSENRHRLSEAAQLRSQLEIQMMNCQQLKL